LNGEYSTKVIKSLQHGHKKDTKLFNKKVQLYQKNPEKYTMPSILNDNENAQELVDLYGETAENYMHKGSKVFPRKDVKMDRIIGQYWNDDMQKYVDTDTFTIIYSKKGVHIYPKKPKQEE